MEETDPVAVAINGGSTPGATADPGPDDPLTEEELTALALAAAFLNAAFDFCLGCQMYLFIRRIWPSQRRAAA